MSARVRGLSRVSTGDGAQKRKKRIHLRKHLGYEMDSSSMSSSPPQKRVKLLTNSSSDSLAPPTVVLGDEYYAGVEGVEAYVGTVVDKTHISRLIQRLKTELPMPENLVHLKRVHGLQIVLTLVTEDAERSNQIVSAVPGLRPTVEVHKVPSKAPKTRKQYEEAKALWPCNFHPSEEIERLLARTLFTSDQVAKHYEWMRVALNVAEEKRSPVGAAVVNPRNGKVLARAHDQRSQNPSNHAVMMVLESVAAIQRESRTVAGPREEIKDKVGEEDEDELPYLCTGYDLYVTREPCIMCAMAMIHCRVRRVFYGHEFEFGALGSRCKVHTNSAMNHHYRVFKNILSDECKTLLKYAAIE